MTLLSRIHAWKVRCNGSLICVNIAPFLPMKWRILVSYTLHTNLVNPNRFSIVLIEPGYTPLTIMLWVKKYWHKKNRNHLGVLKNCSHLGRHCSQPYDSSLPSLSSMLNWMLWVCANSRNQRVSREKATYRQIRRPCAVTQRCLRGRPSGNMTTGVPSSSLEKAKN